MILRFALFFAVMTALVVLGHVYLYRRLVRDTARTERQRRIGLGVLVALGVVMLGGRFLGRVWSNGFTDVVGALSFVWMGVSLFLVLTLLAIGGVRRAAALAGRLRAGDGAEAVEDPASLRPAEAFAAEAASVGMSRAEGVADARPESAAPEVDPERRLFLARAVAGGAGLATAGLAGYGTWRAYHPPEVSEVPIRLPGLPRALDGFSIVQLTDVHVGNMVERKFLDELVGRANALKPDLVAVTGDLVDGDVPALGGAVAALGNLRSRHGTYFVTGNHDYYSGDEEWTAFLRRIGVKVLRNEHTAIGDGAASFDLVGVDDWGARRTGGGYDLDRALSGRDPERASVLLAHQPANFAVAAAKGVGLQVSGHTHGGQIFPFTVFVGLGWDHSAGLYREGASHIYVSRGCGFWGPPMRVGSPPELVKLVLTA